MSDKTKRFFVGGNWKTKKTTLDDAISLAKNLAVDIDVPSDIVEVAVFPSSAHLYQVHEALVGSSIGLGSQNVAFGADPDTGELSIDTLVDAGGRYTILGHSEQRQYYRETNQLIYKRLANVWDYNRRSFVEEITPILCVGETLKQRSMGNTKRVIRKQLTDVLGSFKTHSYALLSQLIIAYEPVWAIGTGQTATPEQAQEVQAYIRSVFKEICAKYVGRESSERLANELRIIYGGSVSASNAAELFKQPDIDGGLIGGASLESGKFVPIVKAAYQANQ